MLATVEIRIKKSSEFVMLVKQAKMMAIFDADGSFTMLGNQGAGPFFPMYKYLAHPEEVAELFEQLEGFVVSGSVEIYPVKDR